MMGNQLKKVDKVQVFLAFLKARFLAFLNASLDEGSIMIGSCVDTEIQKKIWL